MENAQVLKINMLGEFSMTYGDKTINDQSSRSKKLWTLLEYLITFRDKEISQNELIELLWPDDESENPANTLKTLLHRARNAVGELGFAGGKDLIIYRRGTYAWNNDLNILIDTEEFERLLKLSAADVDDDEKLTHMLEAVDLYKGDFLPKTSLELWAVPISTYYHSQYIKLAHDTIDLLLARGRYDDIISVCQRAVVIDPYDEHLHYSMIQALVSTGAQQAALQHYDYVTELFFSQFGVTPSQELTALYKEIIKTKKSMELDLNVIKEGLRETDIPQGAFFSEYAFFKDIYRLQARGAPRTGQTVHIALISVTDSTGEPLAQKQLNAAMERLKATITVSLRRVDIFTRYSVTQYLILLPSASYENGEIALRRVVRAFKRDFPKMNVALHYKLLPLDPVM